MTLTMSIEMPDSFSLELRSLLTGLLQRDVHKRLGCRGRGASELKSHPFFRGIDWRVVYLQRLAPPLIPARGEVNAADAFDIGSFDDEDTKHIKLSDADQELYRNFPVVVSERWQHEIAETIFDYINHEADKAEMKRKSKLKDAMCFQEDDKQSDCILHGYIKRLGGTFTATWVTRYVRLYPNRLEMYSDSGKQPELIFMDQIEEICNDYVQVKGEQCIVIKLYNHSKYVLTNSDEIGLKEWHVSLKASYKESLDMLTTMAEKATKIYGTEIPLKHMGKRRQQLQNELATAERAASSSSSISLSSSSNLSSQRARAANTCANLEQKIIQRALASSSTAQQILLTTTEPPLPAPTLIESVAAVNSPLLETKNSNKDLSSSGNNNNNNIGKKQHACKHVQRAAHHHAHHAHHHHHHAHTNPYTQHKHRAVPTTHAGNAPRHTHQHTHRHAHRPRPAGVAAQTVRACVEQTPASTTIRDEDKKQQVVEEAAREIEEKSPTKIQQHVCKAQMESSSKEKENNDKTLAQKTTTNKPLDTHKANEAISGDIIAETEPSIATSKQVKASGSTNDSSTHANTEHDSQTKPVAILSSSSSLSSEASLSSSNSASNSSSSSSPPTSPTSPVSPASSSSSSPSSSSPSRLVRPMDNLAAANDMSRAATSNKSTVADRQAQSSAKQTTSSGQQLVDQLADKIKPALSLENVSEAQEVLRDPSKRITSDNRQREQDLVEQYEKLHVTSARGASSSSVEE